MGSPLTYSPQVPMEPLARDFGIDSPGGFDTTGMSGAYPAQPKLVRPAAPFFRGGTEKGRGPNRSRAALLLQVPTVLHWSFGGSHVEVEGSWDNWTTRTQLQRSGKDFTIIRLLAPGVYQYKYIVDGQWRYAPNLPAMYDDMGNINNVLEVQEFIPEVLENLTGGSLGGSARALRRSPLPPSCSPAAVRPRCTRPSQASSRRRRPRTVMR